MYVEQLLRVQILTLAMRDGCIRPWNLRAYRLGCVQRAGEYERELGVARRAGRHTWTRLIRWDGAMWRIGCDVERYAHL